MEGRRFACGGLASLLLLFAPAAAHANWSAKVVQRDGQQWVIVTVEGDVVAFGQVTGGQPNVHVGGGGTSTVGDGCLKAAAGGADCAGPVDGVEVQGSPANDSIALNLRNWSSGSTLAGVARGAAGNDTISGGTGYSTGQSSVRLYGEAGNDKLTGSGTADELYGGDGNDVLIGGVLDAADVIDGGPGNDSLAGGGGGDSLAGGPGVDNLNGDGADYLRGFAKDVSITLDDLPNDGEDGEGDNVHSDIEEIYVSARKVNVVGTDAAEQISINSTSGTVEGRGGNDRLKGFDGNETLLGGDGDDYLEGGFGHDILDGGPGLDQFVGDATERNVIAVGNDQIRARDGIAENIDCGIGIDTAEVDATDRVDATCESVDRPTVLQPKPTPGPDPTIIVKPLPGTPKLDPSLPVKMKHATLARGVKLRVTTNVPGRLRARATVPAGDAKRLGIKIKKGAKNVTVATGSRRAVVGPNKITLRLVTRARSHSAQLKGKTLTITFQLKPTSGRAITFTGRTKMQ